MKIRTWVDCGHTHDGSSETIDVPPDIEAAGAAAIERFAAEIVQTRIGNEIDVGWALVEPGDEEDDS